MSPDRSGLVVYLAGTPYDGNRGTDQHLTERLSAHLPVLYVDPPRSVLRGGRTRPELQQVRPGMLRLTPVAPPGHTRWGARGLAAVLLRRTLAGALSRLGTHADAVVVAGPGTSLQVVPARLRVLYGTDDFLAGAGLMGLSRRWLQRSEERQLAQADLVLTVSSELADTWAAPGRVVEVLENGCDTARFAAAEHAPLPSDVRLTGPVAGLVGHLSERIDLAHLEAVADAGCALLLVGPVAHGLPRARFAALLARPQVQWVGARPHEALPGYLRRMTVGLVPYADTAFNRASLPLKTLEYLAAGLPVVAADLPALRSLPPDAVTVASSPQAFARGVAARLAAPPDAAAAAARRRLVAAHDWEQRARRLAGLLAQDLPRTLGAGSARSGPGPRALAEPAAD